MTQFSPATLGKQVKNLEVGGLNLTEAVYSPTSTLALHAHELACLTFVLDGSCIETIGIHQYDCGPHSLIVKPAGESHSNRYSSAGLRCLIIEVKPERSQAIRQFSRALDSVEHLRGSLFSSLAVRTYKEFKLGDGASLLSIEGLVLEMLGELTRRFTKTSPGKAPRWLLETKALCHEHFDEPISLLTMAKSAGVHPAHLARTFRKHYRCTLGEYIRRLRLDHAAQELAHTDKSIVEIALAVGFYDHSHFTHTFKLKMGMTPIEYRTALQNAN